MVDRVRSAGAPPSCHHAGITPPHDVLQALPRCWIVEGSVPPRWLALVMTIPLLARVAWVILRTSWRDLVAGDSDRRRHWTLRRTGAKLDRALRGRERTLVAIAFASQMPNHPVILSGESRDTAALTAACRAINRELEV